MLFFVVSFAFFACSESDTVNGEVVGEVSSSSAPSDDSGSSNCETVVIPGEVEIPDNMAQKDGKCYICNTEKAGNQCTESAWNEWIKRDKCLGSDAEQRNYFCKEVECPVGGADKTIEVCPSSSSQGGSLGSGGDVGTPVNGGKAGAGWASRYWDGCKPSCAWSNNANGNPTKSCAINGTTVLSDPDAQSVTNGGPAHTCYSQVPWAVSDDVAYGFAASHTNGDCGKCFRLTFTGKSEHVANSQGLSNLSKKTMVVKISNIGGDVQGTQLDFMIPGGGLGAFDGFTMQDGVNGSVINGTERSGGFLTECGGADDSKPNFKNLDNLKKCVKDKCDQAFTNADLIAGCKFYADWFEAVNNPKFNMTEVTCPAALNAKW